MIWIAGLEGFYAELDERKDHVRVWGPAVRLPAIEDLPWEARSLSIPDPFGHMIRFNEPTRREAHPYLPSPLAQWTKGV